MKGTFVVIVGPSAVGKTTLVESLLVRIPNATRIVTLTTREPREGEAEGQDFFFVTRHKFEKLRDKNTLIEWSEHFDNYYGTSGKDVDVLLQEHSVVFAVLDINGARQVLEKKSDTLTIFIKPGKLEELHQRLEERGIGTLADRQKRFNRAKEEITMAPMFHHTAMNHEGKFEETVQEVLDIIEYSIISNK